jgi:hypothetical protein
MKDNNTSEKYKNNGNAKGQKQANRLMESGGK